MKLIISPYVSAGPIRLGRSRDEIRATLSSKPQEFQKGVSPIKTDAFNDWHLNVFYRLGDICNAIEMFKGSTPVLHGRELLSTKYVALLDEFRRLDPDLEIDNSSFISRKFGVSVWTEDPGGLPETVLVFERGYYDQLPMR